MPNNNIEAIHLHLGAHKTASTYMQQKLRYNNQLLAKNNILFLGPAMIKPTLRMSINSNTSINRRVNLSLYKKIFSGNTPFPVRHLLLSDENILGFIRYLYEEGEIYPQLKSRMQLIKEFFLTYTTHPLKIFFCIRNYNTFIPSSYCEFIRHNSFILFSEFIGKVDVNTDISWLSMVGIFEEVFGAENITIWKYEDFREKESQVFSAFCGIENIKLNELKESEVRTSVSSAAVKVLEALHGIAKGEDIRKLLPEVQKILPKGEEYSEFSPFTDEERETLNQRYQADCEELKNRFKML